MDKEYTPVRRFYARVGFAALIILAVAVVASGVNWLIRAQEVLVVSGL